MRIVDVFIPSTYQGKVDAANGAVQKHYNELVTIVPRAQKANSGINE